MHKDDIYKTSAVLVRMFLSSSEAGYLRDMSVCAYLTIKRLNGRHADFLTKLFHFECSMLFPRDIGSELAYSLLSLLNITSIFCCV